VGRIERALISVSEKKGIVEFCRALAELKIELVSTGGTASLLRDNKISVKDVAELTGFPEMMDGRVKTLHPKVHGGILALRDNPAHVAKLKEHGILPIDLVVVNLYPFEATVARAAPFEEIVENIDIGGPSMVRAAAKNHQHVGVVVDPADYDSILAELKENDRTLSGPTRFRLFRKAFQHTARYDAAISNYFSSLDDEKKPRRWGESFTIQVAKIQDMRYGENPHQSAAFYETQGETGPSIARAHQIQGKELSFNNILDADAALSTVLEFSDIASVAIKHNNPCGVALSKQSLADSFRKAKACDPVSIFGGVIAFNRPVDEETAKELKDIFLEISSRRASPRKPRPCSRRQNACLTSACSSWISASRKPAVTICAGCAAACYCKIGIPARLTCTHAKLSRSENPQKKSIKRWILPGVFVGMSNRTRLFLHHRTKSSASALAR